MKKYFPLRLSLYLIRNYILNFLILLTGLLAVIYLFDTVELLRRSSDKSNVNLTLILMMSLFKLPQVGQLLFPFAILFSAMLSFWQLNRRQELIIMRSSGLSAWQFIVPILLTAFTIGILKVAVINPAGSLMIGQYKTLESKYLKQKNSVVSLSEQGLWLRQENDQGVAILHADKIQMPSWKLDKVIVFFFDSAQSFSRRIDAKEADLNEGEWLFKNAVINGHQDKPETASLISMATDLTKTDIESSFLAPETISFWKLRSYIKVLEQTGFDSTWLKIHFNTLLAEPFLYIAMILLAASVSMRPPRLRGTAFLVLAGIFGGFFVFFSSSFLQAMGGAGQIPILVAAWFPALITFVLGLYILSLTEDG
jgi:lipopolysaccharide export system permease protein